MRNSAYAMLLLCVIALLAPQPKEPQPVLSIAGIRPGMTRAQVQKIVGHTLEGGSYLTIDKVEVMLDKGLVSLVMGPELNCDGQILHPTSIEALEAALGPADSKPPHEDPACVYAAFGFEFSRHSLSGHLDAGEELEGQFALGLERPSQSDQSLEQTL